MFLCPLPPRPPTPAVVAWVWGWVLSIFRRRRDLEKKVGICRNKGYPFGFSGNFDICNTKRQLMTYIKAILLII
jgi:hypothetical protein